MDQKEDITLDGSTATWIMPRMEGEYGGTYTGAFTFRCYLDPLKQLQAGREYRELLGLFSSQATEIEGNLAYMLVQLKHRILKAPPFWSSTSQESGFEGNIGDFNVISAVMLAAMKAENIFKEKVQKERDSILDKTIKAAEDTIKKQSEGKAE